MWEGKSSGWQALLYEPTWLASWPTTQHLTCQAQPQTCDPPALVLLSDEIKIGGLQDWLDSN